MAFVDTMGVPGFNGYTLNAGLDGVSGPQWVVDYLWFPRTTKQKASGEQSILDIVILHTTQRFDALVAGPAAPIPVATRADMPTDTSVEVPQAQGGHQGLAIEMVGYSTNNLPGNPSLRRLGTGTISGTLQTDPTFGFFVDSAQHGVCSGDSGGPALAAIGAGGALRVVGVLSRFGNPYQDCQQGVEVRGGGYAYIEYSFLDDLCRGAPFENCNWNPPPLAADPGGDVDGDGVPNGIDNCPAIANADQKNCDAEGEADNGLPVRGDACDPNPCPTVGAGFGAIQLAQEGGTTAGTSFPFLHWELINGGPAKISMRASMLDTPNLATNSPPGVHPRYCACQNPANGAPYDETLCKLTACRSHGYNGNLNVYTDVGYQTLIWKKALGLGDCPPPPPPDPDGDGQYNECVDRLTNRSFRRLFRHRGTPLCTDRSEKGCAAGDSDAFWRRDSNTETFVWDWLQQDYPHPAGVYNTTTTQQAYVRVWLHADATPNDTHGNSYSEPVTLYRGSSKLVVSKPVYDLGIRHWWLASPIEPWGPVSVLTPIPRKVGVKRLPDGWAWLAESSTSATRALLSTPFDPAGGALSGSQPGTFVGEPEQALTTVSFGAARFDEATFAFGGEDHRQRLSTGLWYGIAEGDRQFWQPVAGAMPLAAASTGTSATPTGTSATPTGKPVTMPAGKAYQDWRSGLLAKSMVPRLPLAQLAAQKKATFDTTMAARLAAKVATPPSVLGIGSLPMATLSFGLGTPLPQKQAVLLGDALQNTLVAFFGELERPRDARDPVPVAVFGLQTEDAAGWIVGEVEWSCGPRYAVGHAGTGYDAATASRSVLFYGGKLDRTVVDGLFIQTLHPELLFSGQDVTRLDAGAVTSPGPRAHSVLTYDPENRLLYLFGGTDAHGRGKNDLWVFSRDDARWKLLSDGSDPQAPPAVLAGGLVQSPIDGSVVVIAGAVAARQQASIWRWVNGGWRVERQTAGN